MASLAQVLRKSALAAVIVASGSASGVVAAPASIEGTWRSTGGSEIEVRPCGDEFCGNLSWIVIPNEQWLACSTMPASMFGPMILDYNNPDRAQQKRPLLGAPILTVRPTEEPDAYTARIYNAEDGSTNDVMLWVEGSALRLGGACTEKICEVNQLWPRVANRANTPGYTCG